MAKFRSAKSYSGRTPEAKENQRKNLVPGGPWQKKRIEILRLKCWWEIADLESKQFIFEGFEKKRDIKDVPKGELKSEEFLNNWWGLFGFEYENFLYWAMMDPLSRGEKAPILKLVEECLREKLDLIKIHLEKSH